MSGISKGQALSQFRGQGFGAFKPALTELLVERLGPISARMRELMADPEQIDAVLRDGAGQARALAEPVIEEVKRIVGFLKV